jgi:hypothetical protein
MVNIGTLISTDIFYIVRVEYMKQKRMFTIQVIHSYFDFIGILYIEHIPAYLFIHIRA